MKKEHFLNGLPDLLVLRLLTARERYGYEIVAEIRRQSGEILNFGEGCIYPVLHRLVAEGKIRERSEKIEGRVRRYYRLSPAGRRELAALDDRWNKVSAAVNQIGGPAYA